MENLFFTRDNISIKKDQIITSDFDADFKTGDNFKDYQSYKAERLIEELRITKENENNGNLIHQDLRCFIDFESYANYLQRYFIEEGDLNSLFLETRGKKFIKESQQTPIPDALHDGINRLNLKLKYEQIMQNELPFEALKTQK